MGLSCGLQVEFAVQSSACPRPHTHSGRYFGISTQPRARPGHTEAKDPIIPVAEGLDPLFPGNTGIQENTNGLGSPTSPQWEEIFAFCTEGIVSSSTQGEISIGSLRIKAACI